MRSDPLVSVIVPVFNGEAYLAETLDSILDQDYEPIELIIVDDGSTDRSGEIARSYDGVRYMHHENRGPAAARNTGIDAATGEFLTFLDADDLMMPTKVSKQTGYLVDRPDIACVLCRLELFAVPGTAIPPWDRRLPERAIPDETSPPLEWASFLRAGTVTFMVRANATRAIGRFDPRLWFCEDVDWLFRAWESGIGMGVMDEVLVRRRIHENNMTRDRDGAQEGWMRFIKKTVERRRAAGVIGER